MSARMEDIAGQEITAAPQWMLISSTLRYLALGYFSPAAVTAGQEAEFACRTMAQAGASLEKLWPRKEDSQGLETRGALRVELWERIAIITNYLLLKRGKYVTPSKGDRDSKGNTCLKHTGQVYLKGKFVCFWFFITFPIETSKYSCHIFGKGCLILNLKHLSTHTYINMVSISFSCGTSNSCLL